jgi:hypothetical protein
MRYGRNRLDDVRAQQAALRHMVATGRSKLREGGRTDAEIDAEIHELVRRIGLKSAA